MLKPPSISIGVGARRGARGSRELIQFNSISITRDGTDEQGGRVGVGKRAGSGTVAQSICVLTTQSSEGGARLRGERRGDPIGPGSRVYALTVHCTDASARPPLGPRSSICPAQRAPGRRSARLAGSGHLDPVTSDTAAMSLAHVMLWRARALVPRPGERVGKLLRQIRQSKKK